MKQQYPEIKPVITENKKWPYQELTKSPLFCAVDLRDGNQALPNPMTPEQKLEYFKLLVDIGFKQIEIGFPSASRDEFEFTRKLIDDNLIPDDVTIVVLTQAREHLIHKTLEALKGAKNAILHFYIATSKLHYKHVFGFNEDQLFQTAKDTIKIIREARDSFSPGFLGLEFSPEEFTDTDPEMCIKLCDLVIDEWQPRKDEKVILNLPATVERRPPTHYADMIENFMNKLKNIQHATVSLHCHNDQGCAVAATEMAVMAGATRVEGTLFGHGERTGNVDLVTLALNFTSRNIDTGLNFSKLPEITDTVARITQLTPHERHPYAGELVFTAFSGSHQDAIGKCLSKQEEVASDFDCEWKIPYLHIDPRTLGRSFEKFVRINSQSGKGGISYVLNEEYGITLPRDLLLDFAPKVQKLADEFEKELEPKQIYDLFLKSYCNQTGGISLEKCYPRPDEQDPSEIDAEAHLTIDGQKVVCTGHGNGPISAFANAVRQKVDFDFKLESFKEISINSGADASALAYIILDNQQGKKAHGVGMGTNIDQAGFEALISCLNQLKS